MLLLSNCPLRQPFCSAGRTDLARDCVGRPGSSRGNRYTNDPLFIALFAPGFVKTIEEEIQSVLHCMWQNKVQEPARNGLVLFMSFASPSKKGSSYDIVSCIVLSHDLF